MCGSLSVDELWISSHPRSHGLSRSSPPLLYTDSSSLFVALLSLLSDAKSHGILDSFSSCIFKFSNSISDSVYPTLLPEFKDPKFHGLFILHAFSQLSIVFFLKTLLSVSSCVSIFFLFFTVSSTDSESHELFSSESPELFFSESSELFSSELHELFSSESPELFSSESPELFSSELPELFPSESPELFSSVSSFDSELSEIE